MNIENIDIKKTFSEVLHKAKYCHALLLSIEEELAGKPMPVIPKDNMEYILWHHQGLVAFSDTYHIAEYSIDMARMLPFTKLNHTQQKRSLYRASIISKWLFDGLIPPLTLYFVEA